MTRVGTGGWGLGCSQGLLQERALADGLDLRDLPPCSREIGRNSEVPFLHELNDSEFPPRAGGWGIGSGWEKGSFKLRLCYRPALQLTHTLARIGHKRGVGAGLGGRAGARGGEGVARQVQETFFPSAHQPRGRDPAGSGHFSLCSRNSHTHTHKHTHIHTHTHTHTFSHSMCLSWA